MKPYIDMIRTTIKTKEGRYITTTTVRFEPIEKKKCCYRCGRNTHFIDSCYATFHLKGYQLDD